MVDLILIPQTELRSDRTNQPLQPGIILLQPVAQLRATTSAALVEALWEAQRPSNARELEA